MEVKNSIGQDSADHSKRDEVGIGPYNIQYLGDYIMEQVGAQVKEITKLVEQNKDTLLALYRHTHPHTHTCTHTPTHTHAHTHTHARTHPTHPLTPTLCDIIVNVTV